MGVGRKAAEPGDMLLMPPFHDTRFWYDALSYRTLSISRSDNLGKDFLNTDFEQAIQICSKKSKKYACDLLQKEKEAFKIWNFSYTLL